MYAFNLKKMTIYHIKAPGTLQTSIRLPSSKSISNRALILNALCEYPKPVNNLSVCDDTDVVVKALHGKKDFIDVGAAGTAMRFLTAYLAGQPGHHTLTGSGRMKNRPIRLLVDALRSVGAHIDYLENDGFPPIHIEGKTLKGGEISIDGGISSQYISALLMMAPVMTQGLRLHLTGQIISMSYINITIQLMRQFGVVVEQEDQTFTILPQTYTSVDNFTVESDWSAASYWYGMLALCDNEQATVSLPGLLPDSLQGDAGIVDIFNTLGVETTFTPSGVTLRKKQSKKNTILPTVPEKIIPESQRPLENPLYCDLISIPDMAQTLAVTCIMLNRPFRFTGLQSLKIKETDRLHALQSELQKLGYPIDIHNNHTLAWTGQRCIPSYPPPADLPLTENNIVGYPPSTPIIATYNDHRMAMSFAPISFRIREGILITDPEVVTKSYPSFWNDLQTAGFEITTPSYSTIPESIESLIREIPCNPWTDSFCCGQHEVCEHDLPRATRTKIEYYDDYTLDQYSGCDPAQYDKQAMEAFYDVFDSLQSKDVSGWLYSLHLRNIRLPDPLQDEAFLILEEQHKNR